MNKLATLLLAGAMALSATAAQAGYKDEGDDSGRRCGDGAFNGGYVGGTVGYGKLKSEQDTGDAYTLSDDDGGVVAGIHVGYNLQCGNMVFGFESDWNIGRMETSTYSPSDGTTGSYAANLDSKMNFWGTVRGRVGFVHENIMVYATAGLAYAKVKNTVDLPLANMAFENGVGYVNYNNVAFNQTDEDMRLGWTIGGGVEMARDRWVLRAEVLYVDLRDEDHTYQIVAGCTYCTNTTNWDDDFWAIRVGVSYKFGHREPDYEPLK